MFVQVVRARTSDEAAVRQRWEGWQEQLAPGATGWLGGTGGVSDAGEMVAVVRFESAELARRNSDRPEQGEWWQETAKLFDGDATFYDCTDVEVVRGGGSDEAGFVQVIQADVADPDRFREFARKLDEVILPHRPDILGGISARTGSTFIDTVYFTNEAEARANESKELPPDAKALFEEWLSMLAGNVTYIDLRRPWLASPKG